MLNRVSDERLIRSLIQLRTTNEFKAVMEWLRDSRINIQAGMAEQRDEVTLRHQQGAVQVLLAIEASYDTAPTLLPK